MNVTYIIRLDMQLSFESLANRRSSQDYRYQANHIIRFLRTSEKTIESTKLKQKTTNMYF